MGGHVSRDCGKQSETHSVESMEEGLPAEPKPLEISEATKADIFRRKEEGTVTDMQVLALILLDVIQANEEQAAAS